MAFDDDSQRRMMMNRKFIGLTTAALLTVSGAIFAQQKPAATTKAPAAATAPANKTAPTHTTRGTVSAVSGTQLTLSPAKGKKDITFMLGADTQKPTNLAAGDKVTVHYRVENSQNMATSIQATAAKTATNTAKKKS
jgi:hypothetical protein